MSDTVSFQCGRGEMTLQVPDSTVILTGLETPPLESPRDKVQEALQHPIGTESLKALASRSTPSSVAIVISDITRPVPNELLVNAILLELHDAGVPDEAVTIVIATGMHRPSTSQERITLLGPLLLNRCRVVDHEADQPETLVQISDSPAVSVNRIYAEADLKILTGLVEPHFMAGFSGGRKSICPGLVDLGTVQRFHGHAILSDPNAVEGELQANPCHEESLRIARQVGCDFMINVAIDHDRRVLGVYAGDMEQAHAAACQDVGRWNTAWVDEPFDLVLTSSGGYPLDETFYQSVKGMVTALPALKPGGTLLIFTGCREIGSPEYADMMMRFGRDHEAFLRHIAQTREVQKDQWQFQMHARVLGHIGTEHLLLANDELDRDVQSRLAVTPLPGGGSAGVRAQQYLDQFIAENPSARIAAIPEGPYTMLKRRLDV